MVSTVRSARVLALRWAMVGAMACATVHAQPGMGEPPGEATGDEPARPPRAGRPDSAQCPSVPGDSQIVSAEPRTAFWYYCAESRRFYPYVRSCQNGWKIRPASPPAGEQPEPPAAP
jgi:hypothetical protein